jgi:hypothetical protein
MFQVITLIHEIKKAAAVNKWESILIAMCLRFNSV